MPYLLESELGLSYDLRLTEFGNMGHIVPNHGVVLEKVCLSVLVSVYPAVHAVISIFTYRDCSSCNSYAGIVSRII